MKVAILMPVFSHGMESGRIASWLKNVGDPVVRGEPLAEIETDKATIDLEAKTAGTLIEITRKQGEEVLVGNVIGYLETGP